MKIWPKLFSYLFLQSFWNFKLNLKVEHAPIFFKIGSFKNGQRIVCVGDEWFRSIHQIAHAAWLLVQLRGRTCMTLLATLENVS